MRQYQIAIEGVFDTQIAHRESSKANGTYTYKDSNISLNKLLNIFHLENSMKAKISDEMNADPEFWHHRPLSKDMIDYAAQDVVYLPKVYAEFQSTLSRAMLLKIHQKSANWHFYSFLNKNLKGISDCKPGDYVGSYIK